MKLPVSLEIGEKYLKITAAKTLAKTRGISDCIIKNIADLKDDKISALIISVFKELKITPFPLIVSIPRNQVTVRNLHLPTQDKKEIEQILQLHIGRIVPYRKEETIFNYVFLGIDELNYAKVLLAIVHRDILKRLLKISEAAGLFIDRMNLSSCSAWKWVVSSQKDEITASDLYLLLDLDFNYTDFIVFSKNNILFSRSITLEIKGELTQAEIDKLIGEIRQSLVIFHNEESSKNPVKIFLSGASSIGNLKKSLEEEMDMPVKIVPPVYSSDIFKAKSRNIFPDASFSAISELVLEENDKIISFTLPEIQIRKALREKIKDMTILGTLIVYFFIAVLAFFWSRLYIQQAYMRTLTLKTEEIKKDVGVLVAQYEKIGFIKSFLDARRVPVALISELQNLVPSEIMIGSMSLDELNKVTLKGYGYQLSDAIAFTTILEGSKYFVDVTTRSTRTRKLKDKIVTAFEIEFQLSLLPQKDTAKDTKGRKKK
ncbi:MAG: PilN domain-containing protein [Candidatus Omnitrophota bacterium]